MVAPNAKIFVAFLAYAQLHKLVKKPVDTLEQTTSFTIHN